jgi:hypothetical protein
MLSVCVFVVVVDALSLAGMGVLYFFITWGVWAGVTMAVLVLMVRMDNRTHNLSHTHSLSFLFS